MYLRRERKRPVWWIQEPCVPLREGKGKCKCQTEEPPSRARPARTVWPRWHGGEGAGLWSAWARTARCPRPSLGTPGSQVWVHLSLALLVWTSPGERVVGGGSLQPRRVHRAPPGEWHCIAPALLNLGSQEFVAELLGKDACHGHARAHSTRTCSGPRRPRCGICGPYAPRAACCHRGSRWFCILLKHLFSGKKKKSTVGLPTQKRPLWTFWCIAHLLPSPHAHICFLFKLNWEHKTLFCIQLFSLDNLS